MRMLLPNFEIDLEYTFACFEKYSSKLDISRSLIRIFVLDMKNRTFFIAISLLCLFAFVGCNGCSDSNVPNSTYELFHPESYSSRPKRIVYLNACRLFNDMNDTHLSAAQQIGIEPLNSREEIPSASKKLYLVGGPMCYSEPFVVDKLAHSSPFLVKEAYDLLHDIGRNFQDSLKSKDLPPYSIIVSSVLRTDADVKSLSKRNVNASQRSVHCYGTTIDIPYNRYSKHDDETSDARDVDLKAVLTEVLRDLRVAGRCYVKYEVKQACFHITAR